MKLMRTGRHATPSQVERVAEKAGKAAPAMAVTAGALMAVPHGHTTAAATHGTVAAAVATAKTEHATVAGAGSAAQAISMAKSAPAPSARLHAATHTAKASQNYAVRPGDTLSSISDHVYGKSGDWQWLYHVNSKTISDPNLIYPGQVLNVPADPPANYTLPASAAPATTSSVSNAPASGYRARHAAPAAQSSGTGSSGGTGSGAVSAPATVSHVSGATRTSAGTYSCGGLEALWEEAGGSSGEAVMAAEIAMAESGGNPNAISPTNDYGLWQINGSHGAEATLDPLGNARAAVAISGDGSNWAAWTTYVTGAYSGRC